MQAISKSFQLFLLNIARIKQLWPSPLLVLDHHHLSLRFTVTEQVRGHPLSTLVCPTPACPLICYSELFKTEIKSHHSSIKTSHGSILLQSKNQSPPNGFQGLNDLGPPLCLWNLTSSTHSLIDSAPAVPVLCFNMARCSCLGPWHWLFFLVQMFCAGTYMVYSLIWFWSLLRYYFIGNDFCDQPRKKNFPLSLCTASFSFVPQTEADINMLILFPSPLKQMFPKDRTFIHLYIYHLEQCLVHSMNSVSVCE